MRSKGAQLSIAIVCIVLGIMLAVQFKTTERYVDTNLSTARTEELTQALNNVTEERDTLAQEVINLRAKLDNARKTDQATADLQEEIQKANLYAALLPVEGKGIILTLNDSNRTLQAGENLSSDLIHDQDLLIIVNELKASGAEAISINGERIAAMSEIRCAGTTILVNWNKIAPPFTIKAIGNPDMLESGVLIKNGYLESLKLLGFPVNIQKAEKIDIPAYNGRVKFAFGAPMEQKEKAD
jgi:uncharacterized protein YlxW (UPF0749 family)